MYVVISYFSSLDLFEKVNRNVDERKSEAIEYCRTTCDKTCSRCKRRYVVIFIFLEKVSLEKKYSRRTLKTLKHDTERQKRIREAKKEAQEKLAEYRAQKQSEFKNIESNVRFFSLSFFFKFLPLSDPKINDNAQFLGGSEQKIKGDIAKATDVDIDAMREEFRKNKTSGVNLLVDIVKKVEYGVPQALKDMHREG